MNRVCHYRHMYSRRRFLSALLAPCILSLPYAAAQPAPSTRKAMFWKATSGTNVVYLLGSIHLGSKDMYPLAKEIEDAFEGSNTLIVEADIRHADMQKTQSMVLAKGMYPADDSLWNHVSPETRKSVESFCTKFELPVEALARLRPWVVAVTIATVPMLKNGMDPSLGIDNYFLEKSGKKRVVEIESAEWQLNLLSGFSDDMQEKFLRSATEEGKEMMDNLKRLQDAWMTGDADKMDSLIRETSRTPDEITRKLLTDRNPHMAEVAEQYLKGKEPAFLVVGAAHMVGKDGLVALLQKRGYKVEQVLLKK
jgi:uncharacterized protein